MCLESYNDCKLKIFSSMLNDFKINFSNKNEFYDNAYFFNLLKYFISKIQYLIKIHNIHIVILLDIS